MRPTLTLVNSSTTHVTVGAEGFFGYSEMTLPLGHDEFMRAFGEWQAGMMIQVAFKTLSPEQREFMMTGMSVKQQKEIFGDPDNAGMN